MSEPLRIGVLEADHVGERYRHIAGGYGDMFRAMIVAADPTVEIEVHDVIHGPLPADPRQCDAWMITGSAASVYDPAPWIEALSDLVRALHDASVPTVGICFGHQLLAQALGGRTERAATGWGVGALPMDITAAEPWMTPPLTTATLLYSHQDQVTELPPGARLLATAAHCPVAMFAIGDDLVGIQAHPEFGSAYLRALLEDRVDPIGEAETAAAIASLDQERDDAAVARWLLRHIRARVHGRG
ncbi:MAG: glutamine amidotransferase-related protein [Acidimicrobiales bacterium]